MGKKHTLALLIALTASTLTPSCGSEGETTTAEAPVDEQLEELNTQTELLLQLLLLVPELLGPHLPNGAGLHQLPSARVTNFVLSESLWAASRRASRAVSSGTPSIS